MGLSRTWCQSGEFVLECEKALKSMFQPIGKPMTAVRSATKSCVSNILRVMEELIDLCEREANALGQQIENGCYSFPGSNYSSVITFDGQPILPPLMTERRRQEMLRYKQEAIIIETRIKARIRQQLLAKVQTVMRDILEKERASSSRSSPSDVEIPPLDLRDLCGSDSDTQPDISSAGHISEAGSHLVHQVGLQIAEHLQHTITEKVALLADQQGEPPDTRKGEPPDTRKGEPPDVQSVNLEIDTENLERDETFKLRPQDAQEQAPDNQQVEPPDNQQVESPVTQEMESQIIQQMEPPVTQQVEPQLDMVSQHVKVDDISSPRTATEDSGVFSKCQNITESSQHHATGHSQHPSESSQHHATGHSQHPSESSQHHATGHSQHPSESSQHHATGHSQHPSSDCSTQVEEELDTMAHVTDLLSEEEERAASAEESDDTAIDRRQSDSADERDSSSAEDDLSYESQDSYHDAVFKDHTDSDKENIDIEGHGPDALEDVLTEGQTVSDAMENSLTSPRLGSKARVEQLVKKLDSALKFHEMQRTSTCMGLSLQESTSSTVFHSAHSSLIPHSTNSNTDPESTNINTVFHSAHSSFIPHSTDTNTDPESTNINSDIRSANNMTLQSTNSSTASAATLSSDELNVTVISRDEIANEHQSNNGVAQVRTDMVNTESIVDGASRVRRDTNDTDSTMDSVPRDRRDTADTESTMDSVPRDRRDTADTESTMDSVPRDRRDTADTESTMDSVLRDRRDTADTESTMDSLRRDSESTTDLEMAEASSETDRHSSITEDRSQSENINGVLDPSDQEVFLSECEPCDLKSSLLSRVVFDTPDETSEDLSEQESSQSRWAAGQVESSTQTVVELSLPMPSPGLTHTPDLSHISIVSEGSKDSPSSISAAVKLGGNIHQLKRSTDIRTASPSTASTRSKSHSPRSQLLGDPFVHSEDTSQLYTDSTELAPYMLNATDATIPSSLTTLPYNQEYSQKNSSGATESPIGSSLPLDSQPSSREKSTTSQETVSVDRPQLDRVRRDSYTLDHPSPILVDRPQLDRVRRDSYTLDHPSPILVAAHARNTNSRSTEGTGSSEPSAQAKPKTFDLTSSMEDLKLKPGPQVQRRLEYTGAAKEQPKPILKNHTPPQPTTQSPREPPVVQMDSKEGKEEHLHRYLQHLSQMPSYQDQIEPQSETYDDPGAYGSASDFQIGSAPYREPAVTPVSGEMFMNVSGMGEMSQEDVMQLQMQYFEVMRQQMMEQQQQQLTQLFTYQEREQVLLQQEILQQQQNSRPGSQQQQNSRPGSQQQQNSRPSSQQQQNSRPSSQQQQNSRPSSQQQQNSRPGSQQQQNFGTTSEQQQNSRPTSQHQQNFRTNSLPQQDFRSTSQQEQNSRYTMQQQQNLGLTFQPQHGQKQLLSRKFQKDAQNQYYMDAQQSHEPHTDGNDGYQRPYSAPVPRVSFAPSPDHAHRANSRSPSGVYCNQDFPTSPHDDSLIDTSLNRSRHDASDASYRSPAVLRYSVPGEPTHSTHGAYRDQPMSASVPAGYVNRSHHHMVQHQDLPPVLQHRFNQVSAAVKGFLTRKLMKTDKVQQLINTIKDTAEFALHFQQETPIKKGIYNHQDKILLDRVLTQLTAAMYDIHHIFFETTTRERMAIIHQSRMMEQEKIFKQGQTLDVTSRRLSAATKKAMERKKKAKAAEAIVFSHLRPKSCPPSTSSPKGHRNMDLCGPIQRNYQAMMMRALKPIQAQLSPIKPDSAGSDRRQLSSRHVSVKRIQARPKSATGRPVKKANAAPAVRKVSRPNGKPSPDPADENVHRPSSQTSRPSSQANRPSSQTSRPSSQANRPSSRPSTQSSTRSNHPAPNRVTSQASNRSNSQGSMRPSSQVSAKVNSGLVSSPNNNTPPDGANKAMTTGTLKAANIVRHTSQSNKARKQHPGTLVDQKSTMHRIVAPSNNLP